MTLGKFLNLSEPQVATLSEDKSTADLIGLCEDLKRERRN